VRLAAVEAGPRRAVLQAGRAKSGDGVRRRGVLGLIVHAGMMPQRAVNGFQEGSVTGPATTRTAA
jgi:hypothetical protein